jgi:formylglycine-generating enzyme required for sulfatase activity
MTTPLTSVRQALDRDAAIDWYLRNRARSRGLFNLLSPDAYYTRPISLRNPVVFYEGHLPAFSIIALIKRGLGRPGIDERLEILFARGIDPEDEGAAAAASSAAALWPSREEVQAYARRADAAVLDVLRTSPLDSIGRPAMRRLEAVYAALEHEQMHQETLMYMWHQLPYELKRAPDGYRPSVGGDPPARGTVRIPSGTATLGADPLRDPFWWDNEYPPLQVEVPEFDIDLYPVTNQDFLQYVEAGHEPPHFWTRRPDGTWSWRGMFEELPLPMAWPAWVTWQQADAYARWKGRRLPTEAEYHRAAFGEPEGGERAFPWGEEESPFDFAQGGPGDASRRGVFDFASYDPAPVGSTPAGASAWGVHDLIGNGWEWTSTVFSGFPGFEPMVSYPEYSADFFDGQHYVMKGASPVTPRELIRRSFRNWFRPDYPYVFAKFRTVA